MALPITPRGVSIAFTLASLALCALFLAQGATSYAARKLLTNARAAPAAGNTREARRAPGSDPPDALAILQRNAFDISTGPLPKPPVAQPVGGVAHPRIEQPDPKKLPPPCDPAVKLVGAVYSERTPAFSLASFTHGASSPLLLRAGDTFAEHEVVAIYPRAVYLRRSDGTLCALTLFGDPSERPSPQSIIAEGTAPPSAPSSDPELDAAITKLSELHYAVHRSFVDKLLNDPSRLMSMARVVPHEENGQAAGLKLYGIRRNSLLGKLGLQNGDLLRNINGMTVADASSALAAFAQLRSASDLNVAITRRGQDGSLSVGITN